jgi:hypothetical protein
MRQLGHDSSERALAFAIAERAFYRDAGDFVVVGLPFEGFKLVEVLRSWLSRSAQRGSR